MIPDEYGDFTPGKKVERDASGNYYQDVDGVRVYLTPAKGHYACEMKDNGFSDETIDGFKHWF